MRASRSDGNSTGNGSPKGERNLVVTVAGSDAKDMRTEINRPAMIHVQMSSRFALYVNTSSPMIRSL